MTPLLLLAAFASPPDVESTRDGMAEHWAAGTAVRDAVVARDLDAVHKASTSWLAVPVDRDNPVLVEAYARLKPDFELLAKAKNLDKAAKAVGHLGATCAACHQQHDRDRSYLPPAPPANRSAMAYHAAGANWLWAGLVGRSDATFDAGALTLLSSVLPAAPGGSNDREKSALAFEGEVQRLATQARAAKSDADRGVVYGELLSVCARCHVLDDGGPAHTGSPVLPGEGLIVAEMHERFGALATARKALVAGDLKTVREAAVTIGGLAPPAGLPAVPWRPWSAEVRLSASELATVTTRHQGALRLADLTMACGGCHAALGGGPHVPTPDELTDAPGEAEDVLWLRLLSGRELHRADQDARALVKRWTEQP